MIICRKCRKELDNKYFQFRKDSNTYRKTCRRCMKDIDFIRSDISDNIIELFNIGLKKCNICEKALPLNNFHNHSRCRFTGKTSTCKDCRKINKNKQAEIEYTLKRKYNISIEDYKQMLENQKHRCLICNKHVDDLKKKLYVDHNHQTGKVRGLLCQNCNSLLGHAKEDILILKEAIRYIRQNN